MGYNSLYFIRNHNLRSGDFIKFSLTNKIYLVIYCKLIDTYKAMEANYSSEVSLGYLLKNHCHVKVIDCSEWILEKVYTWS